MSKRVENTIVCCPIVYGSEATFLGKKMEGHASHRWKLYLRGPNNEEDLSCFVEKVLFTLHASFAVPIREVKRPPFEVSETGWGEFEAGLRIFFKDPSESPIDLFHHIKLYPVGGPQGVVTKKNVVDEHYDEIVFTEPTRSFYKKLMKFVPSTDATSINAVTGASTATTIHLSSAQQDDSCGDEGGGGVTVFDDSADLERLMGIRNHLDQQINAAKMMLAQIQSNLSEHAPPCELSDDNATYVDQAGGLAYNDDVLDSGSFDFDDPNVMDFSLFAGMNLPSKPFSLSPLDDYEEEDEDDEVDEEEKEEDQYEGEGSTSTSPLTARPAITRKWSDKKRKGMALDYPSSIDEGPDMVMDLII